MLLLAVKKMIYKLKKNPKPNLTIPHFLVFYLTYLPWMHNQSHLVMCLPSYCKITYRKKKETRICVSKPKHPKFTKEIAECLTGLSLNPRIIEAAICSSGILLSSLYLRSLRLSVALIRTCEVIDASYEG